MDSEQFADVRAVVIEPLKFKQKLAIGEDAYTTLRIKNKVGEMWDVCGAFSTGAAIAKSTLVASTFFAPQGALAVLGFGTAVTPVGWVVAAAVLSGGAYVGVRHLLSSATQDRVTVIPTFINTPIDVLAISLFDLIAPLAIKVAKADGEVSDDERAWIRDYFVREWGYDPHFIDAGIRLFESEVDNYSIKAVAEKLAELSSTSPDCNYKAMTRDLVTFLKGVMEADGIVDEREELVVSTIEQVFDEAGRTFSKANVDKLTQTVKDAAKKSGEAISGGLDAAVDATQKGKDALLNSGAVNTVKRVTESAISEGAKSIADATRKGTDALANSEAISRVLSGAESVLGQGRKNLGDAFNRGKGFFRKAGS